MAGVGSQLSIAMADPVIVGTVSEAQETNAVAGQVMVGLTVSRTAMN